jgi:hypothetical protein
MIQRREARARQDYKTADVLNKQITSAGYRFVFLLFRKYILPYSCLECIYHYIHYDVSLGCIFIMMWSECMLLLTPLSLQRKALQHETKSVFLNRVFDASSTGREDILAHKYRIWLRLMNMQLLDFVVYFSTFWCKIYINIISSGEILNARSLKKIAEELMRPRAQCLMGRRQSKCCSTWWRVNLYESLCMTKTVMVAPWEIFTVGDRYALKQQHVFRGVWTSVWVLRLLKNLKYHWFFF